MPRIINLKTKWKSVGSFTLWLFYLMKNIGISEDYVNWYVIISRRSINCWDCT
jgi:hypothetical protein